MASILLYFNAKVNPAPDPRLSRGSMQGGALSIDFSGKPKPLTPANISVKYK